MNYLKAMNQLFHINHVAWLLFKNLSLIFNFITSRKFEEISKLKKGADINLSDLILDLISEKARIKSNINPNNVNKANKDGYPNMAKRQNNNYNNYKPCNYCKKSGHLNDKCWKCEGVIVQ